MKDIGNEASDVVDNISEVAQELQPVMREMWRSNSLVCIATFEYLDFSDRFLVL